MKRSRSRSPSIPKLKRSKKKIQKKKAPIETTDFIQELLLFLPRVLCPIVQEYWEPVVIRIRSSCLETERSDEGAYIAWFHEEIANCIGRYGVDLYGSEFNELAREIAMLEEEKDPALFFTPVDESSHRIVWGLSASEKKVLVYQKRNQKRSDVQLISALDYTVEAPVLLGACDPDHNDEMDIVLMTEEGLVWIHEQQILKSKSFQHLQIQHLTWGSGNRFLALSSDTRCIFLCEWQEFENLASDEDRPSDEEDEEEEDEDKIHGFDLQIMMIPLDALECDDIQVIRE